MIGAPKNAYKIVNCIAVMFLAFHGFVYAASVTADKDAVVKADALRVRSAPSTDAEILAKIPQNAVVRVVEAPPSMAPWVRIRIPDSKGTGWVHGDYLAPVGKGVEKQDDVNDIVFARVSVWHGDPRDLYQEAGSDERIRRTFYGVHGRFAAGTPFTVLVRNQRHTFSASAKQTLDVPFMDYEYKLPVTEIVFEDKNIFPEETPFLAVVGVASIQNYEPIHLTEITDQANIAELEKKAASEAPTFITMNYDYENSAFSARDTRTSAQSLQLFQEPAWLVKYATPGEHADPAKPEDFLKRLLLLWKGAPIDCSTDCGEGIELFSIGKRVFYWKNFDCCDNGIRYVEVWELDPETGQQTSLYENNDFAT